MAIHFMPTLLLTGGASVPPMTGATVVPVSPTNAQSTSTVSVGATVNVAGGSGNFAYSWAKISGGNITAQANNNPTLFSASGLATNETRTAIFRCTVTDIDTGQTINTPDTTVKLQRFGF